jgi:hypothetical protein
VRQLEQPLLVPIKWTNGTRGKKRISEACLIPYHRLTAWLHTSIVNRTPNSNLECLLIVAFYVTPSRDMFPLDTILHRVDNGKKKCNIRAKSGVRLAASLVFGTNSNTIPLTLKLRYHTEMYDADA